MDDHFNDGVHVGAPPTFNSDVEVLRDYRMRFNTWATAARFNEAQALAHLPVYLTGTALDVYRRAKPEDKADLDTLFNYLSRALDTPVTRDRGRSIVQRGQAADETPAQYMKRLRTGLLMQNPNLPYDELDRQLVELARFGCHAHMRGYLYCSKADTPMELQSLMERMVSARDMTSEVVATLQGQINALGLNNSVPYERDRDHWESEREYERPLQDQEYHQDRGSQNYHQGDQYSDDSYEDSGDDFSPPHNGANEDGSEYSDEQNEDDLHRLRKRRERERERE